MSNRSRSLANATLVIPAAAPRQPAWTAAATRARGATIKIGTQSAVTIPTKVPAVAVTTPSASGRSPPNGASTTRVPCT